MKTSVAALFALAMAAGLLAMTGCKSEADNAQGGATMEKTAQYTCSMHPDVVQSSPGKCPKCGMDLVAKK